MPAAGGGPPEGRYRCLLLGMKAPPPEAGGHKNGKGGQGIWVGTDCTCHATLN